jgi:hypothetical protein
MQNFYESINKKNKNKNKNNLKKTGGNGSGSLARFFSKFLPDLSGKAARDAFRAASSASSPSSASSSIDRKTKTSGTIKEPSFQEFAENNNAQILYESVKPKSERLQQFKINPAKKRNLSRHNTSGIGFNPKNLEKNSYQKNLNSIFNNINNPEDWIDFKTSASEQQQNTNASSKTTPLMKNSMETQLKKGYLKTADFENISINNITGFRPLGQSVPISKQKNSGMFRTSSHFGRVPPDHRSFSKKANPKSKNSQEGNKGSKKEKVRPLEAKAAQAIENFDASKLPVSLNASDFYANFYDFKGAKLNEKNKIYPRLLELLHYSGLNVKSITPKELVEKSEKNIPELRKDAFEKLKKEGKLEGQDVYKNHLEAVVYLQYWMSIESSKDPQLSTQNKSKAKKQAAIYKQKVQNCDNEIYRHILPFKEAIENSIEEKVIVDKMMIGENFDFLKFDAIFRLTVKEQKEKFCKEFAKMLFNLSFYNNYSLLPLPYNPNFLKLIKKLNYFDKSNIESFFDKETINTHDENNRYPLSKKKLNAKATEANSMNAHLNASQRFNKAVATEANSMNAHRNAPQRLNEDVATEANSMNAHLNASQRFNKAVATEANSMNAHRNASQIFNEAVATKAISMNAHWNAPQRFNEAVATEAISMNAHQNAPQRFNEAVATEAISMNAHQNAPQRFNEAVAIEATNTTSTPVSNIFEKYSNKSISWWTSKKGENVFINYLIEIAESIKKTLPKINFKNEFVQEDTEDEDPILKNTVYSTLGMYHKALINKLILTPKITENIILTNPAFSKNKGIKKRLIDKIKEIDDAYMTSMSVLTSFQSEKNVKQVIIQMTPERVMIIHSAIMKLILAGKIDECFTFLEYMFSTIANQGPELIPNIINLATQISGDPEQFDTFKKNFHKTHVSTSVKTDYNLKNAVLQSFRNSYSRYSLKYLFWTFAVLTISASGLTLAWILDTTPNLTFTDYLRQYYESKKPVIKNKANSKKTNSNEKKYNKSNEYENQYYQFLQNRKNNEKEIYTRIYLFFMTIIDYIKKINFFKSIKDELDQNSHLNERRNQTGIVSNAVVNNRRFRDINFVLLMQRQIYLTIKNWYFESMRIAFLDPSKLEDRKKYNEQLNSIYTALSKILGLTKSLS